MCTSTDSQCTVAAEADRVSATGGRPTATGTAAGGSRSGRKRKQGRVGGLLVLTVNMNSLEIECKQLKLLLFIVEKIVRIVIFGGFGFRCYKYRRCITLFYVSLTRWYEPR